MLAYFYGLIFEMQYHPFHPLLPLLHILHNTSGFV